MRCAGAGRRQSAVAQALAGRCSCRTAAPAPRRCRCGLRCGHADLAGGLEVAVDVARFAARRFRHPGEDIERVSVFLAHRPAHFLPSYSRELNPDELACPHPPGQVTGRSRRRDAPVARATTQAAPRARVLRRPARPLRPRRMNPMRFWSVGRGARTPGFVEDRGQGVGQLRPAVLTSKGMRLRDGQLSASSRSARAAPAGTAVPAGAAVVTDPSLRGSR